MDWRDVFHQDGSLRDIYIRGTTLVDWQRFLDFVRTQSGWTASFRWDDQERPMPADASDIFEERRHASPLLSLSLQGIVVNCHFFMPDEIELDVDPRQIAQQDDAERVYAFLAQAGKHLRKEVTLTEENSPEAILHRFGPTSD